MFCTPGENIISMEQEVRPAGEWQTVLTAISVKILKHGMGRLRFFTDRKAFLQIGFIGRRNAMNMNVFIIWSQLLEVRQ